MPPQFQPQFNPLQLEPPHRHTFLIVLTILLIFSGIFGVWYFSDPLSEEETDGSTSLTTSKFADWKTYKNEEYGFEITFSDTWIGYKTTKLNDGSIAFYFTYESENQPMIWQALLIGVMPEKEYQQMIQNGDPHPEALGVKDGKIYIANLSQDTPLQFRLLRSEYDKILSTFKFISTSTTGILPPDPGEAGKATLAGTDSDNDGVRDDIQRYIILNVPDSARYREGLRSHAIATQLGLLAHTQEQSVVAAEARINAILCLEYLGKREENLWKEILSLTLNTKERIEANDAHKARLNGMAFRIAKTREEERAACTFNVESLPN